MLSKKRIALFSADGCIGCDDSLLDIYPHLNTFEPWLEISYWPYLLGSSEEDLENIHSFDACFFSGCIRTERDHHLAIKLREKSKVMISVGACACFGGIRGLVNLHSFRNTISSNEPDMNETTLEDTPRLNERAMALDRVVAIDFYIPGCPPRLEFLEACFQVLLGGPLLKTSLSFAMAHLPKQIRESLAISVAPSKGAVFAGERTVCASCSRYKKNKRINSLHRIANFQPNEEQCLLEQGIPCLGIVTREGCGGSCTAIGIPCRGCYGKADFVEDPGIKWLTAIASMFGNTMNREYSEEMKKINDLPGTLYRYNIASQCLLMRD